MTTKEGPRGRSLGGAQTQACRPPKWGAFPRGMCWRCRLGPPRLRPPARLLPRSLNSWWGRGQPRFQTIIIFIIEILIFL